MTLGGEEPYGGRENVNDAFVINNLETVEYFVDMVQKIIIILPGK